MPGRRMRKSIGRRSSKRTGRRSSKSLRKRSGRRMSKRSGRRSSKSLWKRTSKSLRKRSGRRMSGGGRRPLSDSEKTELREYIIDMLEVKHGINVIDRIKTTNAFITLIEDEGMVELTCDKKKGNLHCYSPQDTDKTSINHYIENVHMTVQRLIDIETEKTSSPPPSPAAPRCIYEREGKGRCKANCVDGNEYCQKHIQHMRCKYINSVKGKQCNADHVDGKEYCQKHITKLAEESTKRMSAKLATSMKRKKTMVPRKCEKSECRRYAMFNKTLCKKHNTQEKIAKEKIAEEKIAEENPYDHDHVAKDPGFPDELSYDRNRHLWIINGRLLTKGTVEWNALVEQGLETPPTITEFGTSLLNALTIDLQENTDKIIKEKKKIRIYKEIYNSVGLWDDDNNCDTPGEIESCKIELKNILAENQLIDAGGKDITDAKIDNYYTLLITETDNEVGTYDELLEFLELKEKDPDI